MGQILLLDEMEQQWHEERELVQLQEFLAKIADTMHPNPTNGYQIFEVVYIFVNNKLLIKALWLRKEGPGNSVEVLSSWGMPGGGRLETKSRRRGMLNEVGENKVSILPTASRMQMYNEGFNNLLIMMSYCSLINSQHIFRHCYSALFN